MTLMVDVRKRFDTVMSVLSSMTVSRDVTLIFMTFLYSPEVTNTFLDVLGYP
jgi:hypothetical protein